MMHIMRSGKKVEYYVDHDENTLQALVTPLLSLFIGTAKT